MSARSARAPSDSRRLRVLPCGTERERERERRWCQRGGGGSTALWDPGKGASVRKELVERDCSPRIWADDDTQGARGSGALEDPEGGVALQGC